MTGDLHLCELLGLPCECRRPGRPQTQPHGTLAAVRRHHRHGTPLCGPCKQAQARDTQDRKPQHGRRRRERRRAEWQALNPAASPEEFDAWWQAQRQRTGAITKAAAEVSRAVTDRQPPGPADGERAA